MLLARDPVGQRAQELLAFVAGTLIQADWNFFLSSVDARA